MPISYVFVQHVFETSSHCCCPFPFSRTVQLRESFESARRVDPFNSSIPTCRSLNKERKERKEERGKEEPTNKQKRKQYHTHTHHTTPQQKVTTTHTLTPYTNSLCASVFLLSCCFCLCVTRRLARSVLTRRWAGDQHNNTHATNISHNTHRSRSYQSTHACRVWRCVVCVVCY